MKPVLGLIVLLGVASRAYAGCESAILQGGHTAVKKTEAVKLALSEVRDACYPGEVTVLSQDCRQVDSGPENAAVTRCEVEASCNLCDEGLRLKYEAID